MKGYENLDLFIAAHLYRLGPSKVEIWWETTFGISEDKRKYPNTEFLLMMEKMRRNEILFEEYFWQYYVTRLSRYPSEPHYDYSNKTSYKFQHRHVVDDDIIRNWGVPMREDIRSLGTFRPWIFDKTRTTRDIDGQQVNEYDVNGTQRYVNGTNIRSVNDVAHVWTFPPLGVSEVISVGTVSAEKLVSFQANAHTAIPGSVIEADAKGMRIKPLYYPVGQMRADNAFPPGCKTWMIDLTFRLPELIVGNVPIISQAQYNFGIWQVYYHKGRNKFVLQISPDNPAKVVAFGIELDVNPNTDIRMQIGRENDTWLCAAQNYIAIEENKIVDPNTITISRHTVSFSNEIVPKRLLIIGAGQTPVSFPSNKTQEGCTGLLLKGQLAVWHRLPTDREIKEQIIYEIRSKTVGEKIYYTTYHGQYPWGRGTNTFIEYFPNMNQDNAEGLANLFDF